jgi:hypothetical protein
MDMPMPADPFRESTPDGEFLLDGDQWRAMRDAMRDAVSRGRTLDAVRALSPEELQIVLALFVLGEHHGWAEVEREILTRTPTS